jgi:hypothetical protein
MREIINDLESSLSSFGGEGWGEEAEYSAVRALIQWRSPQGEGTGFGRSRSSLNSDCNNRWLNVLRLPELPEEIRGERRAQLHRYC